jgi:acylphosphatase
MVVHGRVQGVCFRAAVMDNAEREGIQGWVRNLPRVLSRQSSKGIPRQVIDFRRNRPGYAKAGYLDLTEEPYNGESDTVTIRYE